MTNPKSNWQSGLALAAAIIALVIGNLPAWAIDSVAEAFAMQAKRCFDRGQVAQATRLYQDAINQEVKDENDELYVAALRNNLGECYRRLALDEKERTRYDGNLSADECSQRAEDELKVALEKKEEKAGTRTDFLYIAKSLENLASVYLQRSVPRPTDAEALYRKALSIREDKEGKGSPDCASDFLGLGDALTAGDQFSEALENYKKALAIYRKSGIPNDPILGACHQRMAIMYYKWNKLAAAGQHYDNAIAIFTKNLPKTSKNLDLFKNRDLPDFPQQAFGQAHQELEEFSQKSPRSPIVYRTLLKNAIAGAKRLGKQGEAHARHLENELKQATTAKKG